MIVDARRCDAAGVHAAHGSVGRRFGAAVGGWAVVALVVGGAPAAGAVPPATVLRQVEGVHEAGPGAPASYGAGGRGAEEASAAGGRSAAELGTAAAEQGSVSVRRVAGGDRVGTAVAVSAAAFPSAEVAVLARADEAADALAAAPLAAVLGGPVLLTGRDAVSEEVRGELERLGAGEIVVLGGEAAVGAGVVDALAAEGYEVRRVAGEDRYATAAAVAREVAGEDGASSAYVASGEGFADALAVGALAAAERAPVLLVRAGDVPAATAEALADLGVSRAVVVGGSAVVAPTVEDDLRGRAVDVERLAGGERYATAAAVHERALAGVNGGLDVWVADGGGFADALAAGPAAAAAGATLLLVEGERLETSRASAEHLRVLRARLEVVTVVGGPAAVTGTAPAELDALLFGPELPGGGRYLFPDRRVVGFYGSHFDPRLGVLGEQAPSEVGPRLAAQAQPYADLGDRPVLLAFDLIASLATREAGVDGDYSSPSTDEEVQAWLDAARAIDAYLVLDLQTGRTDFLTEARRYERFLREPDVGLALDPEWRTPAPGSPGGGTVGYVTDEEVNATSAWLAQLVVEGGLPEKLLVVHGFRSDMVRDRADVVARPGVALAFHMDGQGSRRQKLETYRVLRAAAPFWNGFKLFYDEDPDLFAPQDVLGLDPVPDLVTYQ